MTNQNMSEIWQEKWQQEGFSAPSLIQQKVYQPLLAGTHVVGISPTGSGKTLAYLLPLMEKVEKGAGNQLLVLVSSQELAIQVAEVAREWAKTIGLTTQSLIGGANVGRQIEKLKTRPEILIGTPGRVLELIKAKKVKAHQLQAIVLDEVDQLLQASNSSLTRAILKAVPKQTQLAFFSATANEALAEVADLERNDYQTIDVTADDASKGVVKHYYLRYPRRQIVDGLRRFAHLADFRGLVFFNQLQDMGSAEEKLLFHHVPVASLASDQNKMMRRTALEMFKTGKITELLTTDVAARGLDIENLEFVINTEVPVTSESYLHRAGRTGRMGKSGTVITFVQDHTLRDLQKMTAKQSITLEEIFLHRGQLHTENPQPNETVNTKNIPKKAGKTTEKSAKKSKKNKNKGARRR